MKKIALLITFIVLVLICVGQVPLKFSYQASLRNNEGNVVASTPVDLNIYLRKSTIDGEVVYSETHITTTNEQGIISIIVGEGSAPTGEFVNIPWEENIFMQIDVKLSGSDNYATLGVTQILSVPYAITAGNAIWGTGEAGQTVTHDGSKWIPNSQIYTSDNTVEIITKEGRDPLAPIFTVKNTNGEVVFAVYESGVRFYIEATDNTKGSKGGFAIGGLSPSKPDDEVLYLNILPESVEFNILETTTPKGSKGGFAIGGLTPSKQTTDYVTVAKDSTFIYTNLTTTGDLNVAGNLYTGGDITSPPVSYNGYTYKTVQIGSQLWMKENLRTILYQDGSAINTFNDVFDYQTNPLYRDSVGLLYSSTAVRSANALCPEGWHVPNQGDFEQMFNWLGGDYWYEKLDLIAVRLMEVGFWDEAMGDLTPNNLSGFSARPGGWGTQPTVSDPEFFDYGLKAYFWTSGDGWGDPLAGAYVLSPVSGESITPIYEMDLQYNELYYVRCLKWNLKDDQK